MQHHKYDLETLENMMPFERELYIMLLSRHIEDANQQQQIQAQQTLSDLNLKVKIQSKTKDKVGKVIQVSPKIGTQVAPGTVVILLIG